MCVFEHLLLLIGDLLLLFLRGINKVVPDILMLLLVALNNSSVLKNASLDFTHFLSLRDLLNIELSEAFLGPIPWREQRRIVLSQVGSRLIRVGDERARTSAVFQLRCQSLPKVVIIPHLHQRQSFFIFIRLASILIFEVLANE